MQQYYKNFKKICNKSIILELYMQKDTFFDNTSEAGM
jgi:hypothetical protein